MANNSNSQTGTAAKSFLLINQNEQGQCGNNVASSATLLSQSVNNFVDNISSSDAGVSMEHRSEPQFPHHQAQKSTITYYQNKMNHYGNLLNNQGTGTNSNNASSGINSMSGGSGKLFCGVMTSNSSSSMLSSSTPSNRRGCDNSQIINNLSKDQTNQFTNLANKLSSLANEALIHKSPQHHYIIGNNNQIIDDKLVANRVLNQANRRRDSIDSQTSLSSSNKFMNHVSLKVLQRRKINFDQNNEINRDSNSVEVELIETDHSLTKTSSISSGSSGIGVSESCNRSNSKKRYFRSLHKSKKSIKTIEATLRNSRSIEQWLDDFGKIQTDICSKTDKLMNNNQKYTFKIGSIENVSALANVTNHKSVKRAKSFCDYDNDNLENIDSSKMIVRKKKAQEKLKVKNILGRKRGNKFYDAEPGFIAIAVKKV